MGPNKGDDDFVLLHCDVCSSHVMHGSKHCWDCGKCVQNFDHHCEYLNTCIGGANYRLYLLLLFAVEGLCLTFCGTITYAIEFLRFSGGLVDLTWLSSPISATLWKGLCIAAILPNIPCLLFISALVGFHCWLVSKNLTTYEFLKPGSKNRKKKLKAAARKAKNAEKRRQAREAARAQEIELHGESSALSPTLAISDTTSSMNAGPDKPPPDGSFFRDLVPTPNDDEISKELGRVMFGPHVDGSVAQSPRSALDV